MINILNSELSAIQTLNMEAFLSNLMCNWDRNDLVAVVQVRNGMMSNVVNL